MTGVPDTTTDEARPWYPTGRCSQFGCSALSLPLHEEKEEKVVMRGKEGRNKKEGMCTGVLWPIVQDREK
jgi:hypothetical protein